MAIFTCTQQQQTFQKLKTHAGPQHLLRGSDSFAHDTLFPVPVYQPQYLLYCTVHLCWQGYFRPGSQPCRTNAEQIQCNKVQQKRSSYWSDTPSSPKRKAFTSILLYTVLYCLRNCTQHSLCTVSSTAVASCLWGRFEVCRIRFPEGLTFMLQHSLYYCKVHIIISLLEKFNTFCTQPQQCDIDPACCRSTNHSLGRGRQFGTNARPKTEGARRQANAIQGKD